jgi:predicted pyridoxine 5'-phosphate oxidase superfamily flavin-nucleotide-binding protein
MQRVVLEQRLGFVATVTPDGRPNVSPKGTTTVFDDHHLMFADIASPGTIENLASNPNVEINVVDPIVRKGYRFKGSAAVYTTGEMFERALAKLRERGSTTARERIRSIVIVDINDAAAVVSPAYYDGATELDISTRWLRHQTDLHRVPNTGAVFYVVLRRLGPQWIGNQPMELQTGWSEHASFMDALVDSGVVILGGPLADEERVVLVMNAESKEAVRATLARDPWSDTHLVVDSIDEWTIRLDGLS